MTKETLGLGFDYEELTNGLFEPRDFELLDGTLESKLSDGVHLFFSHQTTMAIREKVDRWFRSLYIHVRANVWVTELYSGTAFADDTLEETACENDSDKIQFQAELITRSTLQQYSKDIEPPLLATYHPTNYDHLFTEELFLKGPSDEYLESALEFFQ